MKEILKDLRGLVVPLVSAVAMVSLLIFRAVYFVSSVILIGIFVMIHSVFKLVEFIVVKALKYEELVFDAIVGGLDSLLDMQSDIKSFLRKHI